jgi:hypothetical protein
MVTGDADGSLGSRLGVQQPELRDAARNERFKLTKLIVEAVSSDD